MRNLFNVKYTKKKFPDSGDLNKQARVHSGEKPFKCEIRKLKITFSRRLKTHTIFTK